MKNGYELRFKNGDIVYWHDSHDRYCRIKYGMVDTQFSDAVCIDLLDWRETRTIEGIRFDLWNPDFKPRKLPKKWTYDTQLFTLGKTDDYNIIDNIFRTLDIRNKDAIRKYYDDGYIVKKTLQHYAYPIAIIEKGTWYLNKKFKTYTPTTISLEPHMVYDTYEEAEIEMHAYDAERDRIANLSDEEWSIEQITHHIDLWVELYHIPPEEEQRCRRFFAGLDNVEDVETRVSGGTLQWKRCKNKKWMSVI